MRSHRPSDARFSKRSTIVAQLRNVWKRALLTASMTFIVAASAVCRPSPVAAQIVPPSGFQSNNFNAVDAIASRVFAQSELIRANAAAQVDFARARNLHAEAVEKELENSMQRVRAYWTRRAIGEAELAKRRRDPIKAKKLTNSKIWERLKNHPDMLGAGVTSGNALNWFLQRLAGNALAYESSNSYADTGFSPGDMQLTSQMLHGLMLRQLGKGGNELDFRANEGIGMQIDWWPLVLRAPEFDSSRERIMRHRQVLVQEAMSTGKVSYESVTALDNAIDELIIRLHENGRDQLYLSRGFKEWSRLRQADTFLKSLIREVGRIEETGNAEAFTGELRFDPADDGDSAIALLKFMWRNGLDFAPAQPGDEAAYYQLFAMLRDIYINVAKNDEGINPDPEYRKPSPPAF